MCVKPPLFSGAKDMIASLAFRVNTYK